MDLDGELRGLGELLESLFENVDRIVVLSFGSLSRSVGLCKAHRSDHGAPSRAQFYSGNTTE